MNPEAQNGGRVRLDKWLWAARHFKTRALAAEAIERGRVEIQGQPAKASRQVRPGDRIRLRREGWVQEFEVLGLAAQRGPATVARTLYAETPASLEAAQRVAEARRMGVEPALAHDQGRPTKRDRRQLADWQRWSARLDDDA